ncbi:MAG: hypothetical protein KBT27_12040 [Prevotellaceae bacterium]|nr:hypothetical protein [Candidatus Faecinaster equi]
MDFVAILQYVAEALGVIAAALGSLLAIIKPFRSWAAGVIATKASEQNLHKVVAETQQTLKDMQKEILDNREERKEQMASLFANVQQDREERQQQFDQLADVFNGKLAEHRQERMEQIDSIKDALKSKDAELLDKIHMIDDRVTTVDESMKSQLTSINDMLKKEIKTSHDELVGKLTNFRKLQLDSIEDLATTNDELLDTEKFLLKEEMRLIHDRCVNGEPMTAAEYAQFTHIFDRYKSHGWNGIGEEHAKFVIDYYEHKRWEKK